MAYFYSFIICFSSYWWIRGETLFQLVMYWSTSTLLVITYIMMWLAIITLSVQRTRMKKTNARVMICEFTVLHRYLHHCQRKVKDMVSLKFYPIKFNNTCKICSPLVVIRFDKDNFSFQWSDFWLGTLKSLKSIIETFLLFFSKGLKRIT